MGVRKGFGCYDHAFGQPIPSEGIDEATYREFFDQQYRAAVEATVQVLFYVRHRALGSPSRSRGAPPEP